MDVNNVEERIVDHVSGKLKCRPSSARYKSCKDSLASVVCHECGAPLCTDCMKEKTAYNLYLYNRPYRQILYGLLVLIILPTLGYLLSDYGFSLASALFSALIIFIAIILPIEYLQRRDIIDSDNKKSVIKLVVKKYQKSVHCKKCVNTHNTETWIYFGILALGIILVVLGVQGIILGIVRDYNFGAYLIFMSLGIAFLMLKDHLTKLTAYFLSKY